MLCLVPLPYEGESVELISVHSESTDKWYEKMKADIVSNPDKFPLWKVEDDQVFKSVNVGHKPAQWNRVIPKELRKDVLLECHDSALAGHFGVNKAYNRVRQLYYWRKMNSDVRNYVSKCETCCKIKVPQSRPVGLMGEERKISAPFQVLSTDLMGPFPKSPKGYRFLVVTTCLFLKYVWLRPLRDSKTEHVMAHLVADVFLKYGVPGTLICDNGPQFRSINMKSLCDEYGIKLLYNYYYHAQANPTERMNRVVKTMIRAYVKDNHRLWDKNLHCTANVINTAVHDVTGYSPHELMFGEVWKGHAALQNLKLADGNLPEFGPRNLRKFKEREKIREDIVKKLNEAYKKNAVYFNFRRRDFKYQVGKYVLRENKEQSDAGKYFSAKLAPRYVGPLKIIQKIGTNGYLLETDKGKHDGPWHAENLKPAPDVNSMTCIYPRKVTIASWNVSSARAVVKKGGWDSSLNTDPDIICLQETRCPIPKVPVAFLNLAISFPIGLLAMN